MKRSLVILSFMVSMYGWCDATKSIHLVEDPWPPYTYGELSSEPKKGAVVEVLKHIFKNVELKLTLYPWKRALAMAQEGVVDGLMLTVETKEREKEFVFSVPLFRDEIVFIARSDTMLNYTGLHSLQGVTIGTVHGSKYSDEFQDAIRTNLIHIEPADEIQTNIKKLINKRIDVIIASKIAFCGAHKELYADKNYTIFSPALKQIELKIAISKQSPFAQEINAINTEIARFIHTQSYKDIINRYFDTCSF